MVSLQAMSRAIMTLISILVLGGCSAPGRFVVKLSADEIQERIDQKFPERIGALVFEVRLESPVVALNPGTDRLELTFRAIGLVADVSVGYALATVTGGIRYERDRAEFLLTDPHIIHFDASHIPKEYLEPARSVVYAFINGTLPSIPIYRLDKPKHQLKRALLKKAWVCEGELCLELGI
jgi:hypothetical protein